MAETTPPVGTPNQTPEGHLTMHVDETHPRELHFSFERQPKRMSSAVGMSVAVHAAIAIAAFVLIRSGALVTNTPPVLPYKISDQIVWLDDPGPGGGGGGGGNNMPEPPRPAEMKGEDKITVPVTKAPEVEIAKPDPEPEPEPEPVPQLNIPAMTLAAALQSMPGVIEAPPGPPTTSRGMGTGPGAGGGRGSGIGPGTGSGLGDGTGGGTGGGVYQPGNGVTMPEPISQAKPLYTGEAMRARVQGEVLLECVVQVNGSVDNCSVARSLDARYGLDQEAIKAARQWRFKPGTRQGQPVPVLVLIGMDFFIR